MSGICGWLANSAAGLEQNLELAAMTQRLGPQSHRAIDQRTDAGSAVACAGLASSVASSQGVSVAVQGCPRWTAGADRAWLQQETFHGQCAIAYRQTGSDFLRYLDGPFALALIDQNRRTLLLAVDRTGTESLCFAHASGGILFASTTDALAAHPSVGRNVDSQALYDYVYFHMVPGPSSIFRGIERVLPGHCIECNGNGTRAFAYWQPDYRDVTYEGFADRKRTLRELLHASVADAVCGGTVGAFLSGGLDSSTVAGVLSEVTAGNARTFSIGFDAPGYDESEYARTAARHFGTQHREYYVTPEDVVAAVPLIAEAFDTPFGNASAIPAYYCAQLAGSEGVDIMLGGDGGDELFGGNSRYAKQWVFSLYEQIPGMLRRSLVEPAVNALPSLTAVRKARSYVDQANLGLPDRIESYNLLNRLGPEQVFTDEFLAGVNVHHPIAHLREIYNGAQADCALNRMLALDMRVTLADNDLRKVTRACDAAGVAVAFPFLDGRLVEFAQHLPPDWKVKRTRLRDFFKRALADFLPPEVISKSKHGFGLPFGVWMQTHPGLHRLANDSLSRLRGRGLVRPTFIDQLTGDHVKQHAAYYGTMVWVLMMLEQWLESREIY